MLAVTFGAPFHEILAQLRRIELPRILGRRLAPSRRIVVGGVELRQQRIAKDGPGFPRRALAAERRTLALRILNDSLGVGLEEIAALIMSSTRAASRFKY